MPKSNWKTDTNWLDDLESDLKKGAQRVCTEHAKRGLEGASAAVPVDKGALKASGYLETPTQSGYEAAVAAARVKPDTRITNRDMVESKRISEFARAQMAWALFDFPLSYSQLVNNGYYHARAGRQIPAVHFIEKGESLAGDFEKVQQKMLNELMRKYAKYK